MRAQLFGTAMSVLALSLSGCLTAKMPAYVDEYAYSTTVEDDADADTDADSDSDTDTDADADSDADTDTGGHPLDLFEGDDLGECSDGADNDQDGLFDCEENLCAIDPNCDLVENNFAGECSDGADNDQDGLFDCPDPDCDGSVECPPVTATGDTGLVTATGDTGSPVVIPTGDTGLVAATGDTGGPTGPLDSDLDGFPDIVDCSPFNDNAFPGAVEYLNGIDDDCDLLIDEGFGGAAHTGDTGSMTTATGDTGSVSPTPTGDTGGSAPVSTGDTGLVTATGDTGLPPAPLDSDQDGFEDGDDCSPFNDLVYPGAPEYCDTVDNDCNSIVDDNPALGGTAAFVDADLDAYGNDATVQIYCTVPAGLVTQGGDCRDTNNLVHPGAIEFCDTVDNDCDGVTDEGCPVDTGSSPPASTGDTAPPAPTGDTGGVVATGDTGFVPVFSTGDTGYAICGALGVSEVVALGDEVHTAYICGSPPNLLDLESAFMVPSTDPKPGIGAWQVTSSLRGWSTTDLGPSNVSWPVGGPLPDSGYWSAIMLPGNPGGVHTNECIGLTVDVDPSKEYVVTYVARSTTNYDNPIELVVNGLGSCGDEVNNLVTCSVSTVMNNVTEVALGAGYFAGALALLDTGDTGVGSPNVLLELCTGKLDGGVNLTHIKVREATITP